MPNSCNVALPHTTFIRPGRLDRPLWPLGMRPDFRNQDSVIHDHDFIEIAIMLSGTGTHHSLHGDQVVGAGDVFILRPGAWHGYRDCRDLQLFNFMIGTEFLERDFGFVVHNPLINYLFWAGPLSKDRKGILSLHLDDEALSKCRRHITECHDLHGRYDGRSQLQWISSFLLVLNCLTGSLGDDSHAPDWDLPFTHQAVQEGIRLLEAQPAHNWTLSELSEQLHFNPSYLVRIFKKNTGLAPLRYLARYRAEQAAQLLLSSERSIADIGAQVGWTDPSYFSQRFKTHFGLSAGEYRRRFAGGPTPELDSPIL